MASGCCSAGSGFANVGLSTHHAYTVLGAVTLSNGQKLLKMRNPWGREGYTGPYSDESNEWNDKLRKEAGSVIGNDGIFFLPLDIYMIAYTDLSIVMYNDHYKSHKVNVD
jgi:hypothetical protein